MLVYFLEELTRHHLINDLRVLLEVQVKDLLEVVPQVDALLACEVGVVV